MKSSAKVKKRALSPGAFLVDELKRRWQLYLMLVLPLAYLIIFCYVPMGGVIIAFKAVSYTHLDVYKRQHWGSSPLANTGRYRPISSKAWRGGGPMTLGGAGRGTSSRPSQGDVYKRQGDQV